MSFKEPSARRQDHLVAVVVPHIPFPTPTQVRTGRGGVAGAFARVNDPWWPFSVPIHDTDGQGPSLLKKLLDVIPSHPLTLMFPGTRDKQAAHICATSMRLGAHGRANGGHAGSLQDRALLRNSKLSRTFLPSGVR